MCGKLECECADMYVYICEVTTGFHHLFTLYEKVRDSIAHDVLEISDIFIIHIFNLSHYDFYSSF